MANLVTHFGSLKYGLDPQEEMLKEGNLPGAPGWGEEPEELWGILNQDKEGSDQKQLIGTIPGNYLMYYDSIWEHLRKGKALAVKAASARDVITIIEAAYESSNRGESIRMH